MQTLDWAIGHFNDLTLNQLYAILVLRQEVFVIEQDCPYLDADGKDQNSHHMMGFDDKGVLAAYSRICDPGVSYQEPAIGRIVTAYSFRGKGLGKELMIRSIQETENLYGSVSIRISAQKYLVDFYASFQFKIVGDEYMEDGIPHVEMIRERF